MLRGTIPINSVSLHAVQTPANSFGEGEWREKGSTIAPKSRFIWAYTSATRPSAEAGETGVMFFVAIN
jgi:hypothetical protein